MLPLLLLLPEYGPGVKSVRDFGWESSLEGVEGRVGVLGKPVVVVDDDDDERADEPSGEGEGISSGVRAEFIFRRCFACAFLMT